jgi:hypothetical protein
MLRRFGVHNHVNDHKDSMRSMKAGAHDPHSTFADANQVPTLTSISVGKPVNPRILRGSLLWGCLPRKMGNRPAYATPHCAPHSRAAAEGGTL